jgi:hypothetical protein
MIFTGNSARYFFAPNVVLLFLIVTNIDWQGSIIQKVRSGSFAVVFVIALILSIVQYHKYIAFTDNGPRWTEEVLQWQKDETYKINIWPSGWQLEIRKHQR